MSKSSLSFSARAESLMASPGSVGGLLRWLRRVEAVALLLISLWAYAHLGGAWAQFALLFLLPDLALLAYFHSPRIGALAYHATHSYIGAALLLGAGAARQDTALMQLGCIWFAHIGFDRAMGFGLKYASGFRDTHIGRIGKQ